MSKISNKTLSTQLPLVMGILNVTPDSFYDGGKITDVKTALQHTEEMLKQGASIIDIGGCSTRPGSIEIPVSEETERVVPVIEAIKKEFADIVISIDTYRAPIAKTALELGADIINDISGGTMDDNIFVVAAKYKATYVLSHIQGTPQNMQHTPSYGNITNEVSSFFENKINELKKKGVEKIIIDPGFGFGKSLEHNYELLASIEKFKTFGLPILIGVSRKSMINKVIHSKPENALNGTSVINTIALLNGADILRVHDVKEAAETIKLVSFYRSKAEKSVTKY